MQKVESSINAVKNVVLNVTISATVEEWQQIQNAMNELRKSAINSTCFNAMYWLIYNSIDPLFKIIKISETDLKDKETISSA